MGRGQRLMVPFSKIKEVHKGAAIVHVEIELKGGETVTSSITNEAVEELGLKKAPKPTRSSKRLM